MDEPTDRGQVAPAASTRAGGLISSRTRGAPSSVLAPASTLKLPKKLAKELGMSHGWAAAEAPKQFSGGRMRGSRQQPDKPRAAAPATRHARSTAS